MQQLLLRLLLKHLHSGPLLRVALWVIDHLLVSRQWSQMYQPVPAAQFDGFNIPLFQKSLAALIDSALLLAPST